MLFSGLSGCTNCFVFSSSKYLLLVVFEVWVFFCRSIYLLSFWLLVSFLLMFCCVYVCMSLCLPTWLPVYLFVCKSPCLCAIFFVFGMISLFVFVCRLIVSSVCVYPLALFACWGVPWTARGSSSFRHLAGDPASHRVAGDKALMQSTLRTIDSELQILECAHYVWLIPFHG